MYTRFTIDQKSNKSGSRQGILGAAFRLQKSGRLVGASLEQLTNILDWLQDSFITPDIFDKPENLKGVCWFKDQQVEIIEKVKSLIPIMENNHLAIRIENSISPGKIIYEDIYQVVAIP